MKGLYRARDGKFLGVCQGIARYQGWPVFLVRAAAIIFTIMTGFWIGIGIYVLAGMLLDPEPVIPEKNSYASNNSNSSENMRRSTVLQDLKEKMDRVEKRIRRMEDIVVKKQKSWDDRFYAETGVSPKK